MGLKRRHNGRKLYNILLHMFQLSDILDEGFLETMEKSDGEATLPLPGDGARIMKGQYFYFLYFYLYFNF